MLYAMYTGAPGFHILDLELHFDAVMMVTMSKISQGLVPFKVVGGLWFLAWGFL